MLQQSMGMTASININSIKRMRPDIKINGCQSSFDYKKQNKKNKKACLLDNPKMRMKISLKNKLAANQYFINKENNTD